MLNYILTFLTIYCITAAILSFIITNTYAIPYIHMLFFVFVL